jgi:lipopolysaccharide export system permease protein
VTITHFLSLFLLILPWLLLFIIPVSLLIAVMLVMQKLITNNEIIILRNTGLTKFQISKSVIFLSLIIAFFSFFVSMYLMPMANKELRISKNNLFENYNNLSINPKTFESLKNMTIYVRDRKGFNELFGILINDRRNPDYSLTLTAESGKIVSEDSAIILLMKNGTIQRFNEAKNKSEILNFDSYVFNLSEGGREKKMIYWKAKERFLPELLNPEYDINEEDVLKFKAEMHQRIIYPIINITFSLIALASMFYGNFSRSGVVKNIIFSIAASCCYLVINLVLFDLIESSVKFIPILYLNSLIFIIISIIFLSEKSYLNLKNK